MCLYWSHMQKKKKKNDFSDIGLYLYEDKFEQISKQWFT